MFVIALGTYVAYEFTVRNRSRLSSSSVDTKELKPGTEDKPVFDL
jgi:hypothetical protein